jgi:hypothetical protein
MNRMKSGDPYVSIWVFTRTDVVTIGDAVLDAVTEDPDLAPQKFGLGEPCKLNLAQAKSLWREEAARPFFGEVYGERRRPFEVHFLAVFGIVPKQAFHYVTWSSHPMVLHKVAIGRIEALFHRLIATSNPYLAIGYHSDDFERQNVYRDFRHEDRGSIERYRVVGVHPERFLPGLYWLNYFGPELTASMPALAKRACGAVPHGKGTLLKLADDPRQMTTPESIERIEQCKRKLGERRFFVKNPELEEDGETIELNLTGAPLPTRRSGDGSK